MIVLPAVFDDDGRSNKEIFTEMSKMFRDPSHEIDYEGFRTVLISTELAEQLADFFERMAKAIADA